MPGSCRPSPYPGNLEHPRLSEQEGCRAKETREGKGPHRAAKRRPFLRGTGPDTPLPFNGTLCTGAAAACCEMIIFCFLPVHGLMFSSSSEEKEWENIVAYIPSQRAAEIAFSQKSSWFCEYFMDSQGSETPETRSLTLPNLPVFGKSRKMGLGFRE